MTSIDRDTGLRRIGFLAVLLISTVSLKANPIAANDYPFSEVGPAFTITLAIFAEAICILFLLRKARTPRLFILWLMVMHLFTYPGFLGLLWLLDGLHPILVVLMGEGLIVLIEGSVIYLMCRSLPSATPELPMPSVSKSFIAALAGNICSVAAFPLFVMFFGLIDSSIGTLIGR